MKLSNLLINKIGLTSRCTGADYVRSLCLTTLSRPPRDLYVRRYMNTRSATVILSSLTLLVIIAGYFSNYYTANKYSESLSINNGNMSGCNVTYLFPFVVRIREYAKFGIHISENVEGELCDFSSLTDETRISFFGYLFDDEEPKKRLDSNDLDRDSTLWKNKVGFQFN